MSRLFYNHHRGQVLTALHCLFLIAICCTLLSACDDRHSLLPPSGGKLYEVLVVGDSDGIVQGVLRQDAPGLPQSEPMFDVSTIDRDHFGAGVSATRNIIMVDVNPGIYSSPKIKYEKNVWAEPQTVVHIHTPSMKMLRDSISRLSPTLLRILSRTELKKNISLLRNKRNIKMERLVKKMFGFDLWIPMEMTSYKKGKNFLWMSNNSPTTMKNIVIYKASGKGPSSGRVPADISQETQRFIATRDSILGENIKGETDAMFMRTVANTVSSDIDFRNSNDRRRWLKDKRNKALPIMLYRGLWDMEGDDMGGPFVSRTLAFDANTSPCFHHSESIVIEGFVFAPGKKKRNAVKELEAVLYTAKKNSKLNKNTTK